MTDVASDKEGSGKPRSKVARLIERYDLCDIGAEMERKWTADEDRLSLRDLAEYFNCELLAETTADAGLQPVSDEVETLYDLLESDDTSDADRTRIRRRLERDGVDVDELRSDFVTYQAIRTYLTEYRDAEYETDERDRAVVEAENVQRLRGRAERVTDSKLEQLRANDELVLGDHRLFVDIDVLCEECGRQFAVEVLLKRGGCGCLDAADE
jgi:DNA-binding transcriptional ArsR family regulator